MLSVVVIKFTVLVVCGDILVVVSAIGNGVEVIFVLDVVDTSFGRLAVDEMIDGKVVVVCNCIFGIALVVASMLSVVVIKFTVLVVCGDTVANGKAAVVDFAATIVVVFVVVVIICISLHL